MENIKYLTLSLRTNKRWIIEYVIVLCDSKRHFIEVINGFLISLYSSIRHVIVYIWIHHMLSCDELNHDYKITTMLH
jgi:hypothetical protein